ncbi:hypothetical protein N9544_07800 [Flavobacteriales bacterium]|nr:hypothetical protein [Flavobacteriales bacterium]
MDSKDVMLLLIIIVAILGSGFIFYIIVGGFNKKTPPAQPSIEPYKPKPVKQVVDEKQKHLFPLKLQAYERIVLFMERIEPSNLVMRSKTSDITAQQLHGVLLNNIREEYEHNVSQQIYISDNAWNITKQAKEETINIINLAANTIDKGGNSNDLTRSIFEKMMVLPKSPSQIALDYLKAEIKEVIK